MKFQQQCPSFPEKRHPTSLLFVHRYTNKSLGALRGGIHQCLRACPLWMDMKRLKRDLVNILGIISSEFSSRIRQEDSVQNSQENWISFYR